MMSQYKVFREKLSLHMSLEKLIILSQGFKLDTWPEEHKVISLSLFSLSISPERSFPDTCVDPFLTHFLYGS